MASEIEKRISIIFDTVITGQDKLTKMTRNFKIAQLNWQKAGLGAKEMSEGQKDYIHNQKHFETQDI